MVVLSLFDGMSCGQLALNRAGIQYSKYYACEIDKHAMVVTQSNYSSTIQLGDVTKVYASQLDKVDLLIGGSPCQGFSFAGKQLNFSDPRSKLFFEYVRLLRECTPRFFLLENVKMKKEYAAIISEALGVDPIEINSALVSAQNRKRLYWTNIPVIPIEDKGIKLKDILEVEVGDKYYLSEQRLGTILKSSRHTPFINNKSDKHGTLIAGYYKIPTDGIYLACAMRGRENDKGTVEQKIEIRKDNKSNCVTSVNKDSLVLSCDYRSDEGLRISKDDKARTLCSQTGGLLWGGNGVIIKEATKKGFIEVSPGDCFDAENPSSNTRRGRSMKEKSNCLMAKDTDFLRYEGGTRVRRLTPVECERLQTVPDNYTRLASDSQRYKMLGNGWTIDVIAHIFKNLDLL